MNIKELERRIAYVAEARHKGMKVKDIASVMNLSTTRVCQYYNRYVFREMYKLQKTGEYPSFDDMKKRLLVNKKPSK